MSWDRMSNDLDAQIVKNDSADGLSKEQLLEQCPVRGKRHKMSTREGGSIRAQIHIVGDLGGELIKNSCDCFYFLKKQGHDLRKCRKSAEVSQKGRSFKRPGEE